jgi:hypothetical protein
MQLITRELLNPVSFHPFSHKAHPFCRLRFKKKIGLILKLHVIDDLSMMCEVHAILI